MSEARVASRYADALIEIAAEGNRVDEVGHELARIAELFAANDHQLGTFIGSPVFTSDERAAVLDQVIPRLGLHPQTVNLVKLMNVNGRLGVFSALIHRYNELADAHNGRVRVSVTTAEALTPALESEIRAALEQTTGKTVLVEHTIDPSLIGGMIARVGGTVYDSSLRTRLASLKHALTVAEA